MWPILFHVPGLGWPIRAFGVLVAAGFLAGVTVAQKLARRYGDDPGQDPQRIADVALWVLVGVVLGGRIAYVLVNLDQFRNPLEALAIWQGGLVMYGGLILALLLGVWKAHRLGMNMWRAADYGLTAGFLGQGIGRIGCLLVGDDYGRPTDLPWGIRFPWPLPEGSLFPPELAEAGIAVHPSQLYMVAKGLLLFGFGVWLLKRRSFGGQVTCALLAGYAILRFLIEYTRGDSVARGGIWNEAHTDLVLSTSQVVGLVVLPVALALYLYRRRRDPLPRP